MRIEAEIHIHLHQVADQTVSDLLTQILENQQTERAAMSQMDDKITEVKADVAATRTVVDSAIVALNGIGQLIADAVADAIDKGATPEQLQSMTDLGAAVKEQGDDLAAAIPANTPPA